MTNSNMEAEALVKKIESLEAAVEKLTGKHFSCLWHTALANHTLLSSAESDVRKLQNMYGYYLDKCLYKEVRINIPAGHDLPDKLNRPARTDMDR